MKKPLDIVRTPKGGIAVITETSLPTENFKIPRHSIDYITNPGREHNAWWNDGDLTFLHSIPAILVSAMAHPFGSNGKLGLIFYPEDFKGGL